MAARDRTTKTQQGIPTNTLLIICAAVVIAVIWRHGEEPEATHSISGAASPCWQRHVWNGTIRSLLPGMAWAWRNGSIGRYLAVGVYVLAAGAQLTHLWVLLLPPSIASLFTGFRCDCRTRAWRRNDIHPQQRKETRSKASDHARPLNLQDYYPILGGIENHVKLLAEGLSALGVQTQVLVTNTANRTGGRESIGGVPVLKTARQVNVSSAPV